MDNASPLWLNQVRYRQGLMDSMMEKCGVDVLEAVRAENGDAFFSARAKCRDCVHEDDCRNWCLESPPNFCANAEYFRMCKGEDYPLDEHTTLSRGTIVAGRHSLPTESFEQRASRELLKLIAKLRWLGEDDEANQAHMQLTRILARMQLLDGAPYAADVAVGMLNDTD